MTSWANILAEIRRTLKETTADHWTDAELLIRANNARREITQRTRCTTDHNRQNLTANTRAYSYPSATLGHPTEVRVKHNSSDSYYYPCSIVTKQMVNKAYAAWEEEKGDPQVVYFESGYVKLVPKPASSITSGLDVSYTVMPTDMSATTSKPWKIFATAQKYLNSYTHLIVEYVLWKCYLEDGNTVLADRYAAMYGAGIEEMENDLTGPSGLAWGSSRGGGARSWISKLD